MIKLLLVAITMSITSGDDDVDFSGFNFHKTEAVKADLPPPNFPAQSLPENPQPKLYTIADKFGKEWKNIDKAKLDKDVAEENKKPFIMKDVGGRLWQSQDKQALEKFVNEENVKMIKELNYYLGIR